MAPDRARSLLQRVAMSPFGRRVAGLRKRTERRRPRNEELITSEWIEMELVEERGSSDRTSRRIRSG